MGQGLHKSFARTYSFATPLCNEKTGFTAESTAEEHSVEGS